VQILYVRKQTSNVAQFIILELTLSGWSVLLEINSRGWSVLLELLELTSSGRSVSRLQ